MEENKRPQPNLETLKDLQGKNAKVDFISIAVFEKLLVSSTPADSPFSQTLSLVCSPDRSSLSCSLCQDSLSPTSRDGSGPSPASSHDSEAVLVKREPLDNGDNVVEELVESYLDIRPHSNLSQEEITAKLQEGYVSYMGLYKRGICKLYRI